MRPVTRTDRPHLLFATAIAGWCVWFGIDAWRAQASVENLIMIAPISVAALILYVVIAAGCFRAVSNPRPPLGWAFAIKVVTSMALLAAYAVAGPLLGFDVATLVFLAALLFVLGERRILALLLVPLIFCAIAIYSFTQLLETPLPMLLFFGDGS